MKKLALKLFLAVLVNFIVGSAYSKLVVVTDIDDTIRKSNVLNLLDAFKRLKNPKPFGKLRDIFIELKANADISGEKIEFAYISASLKLFYNADMWLKKYHFPKGHVKQKKLFANKFKYKLSAIKMFLKKINFKSDDTLLLFGDNSEVDAEVYSEVVNQLRPRNFKIFIRDIKMKTVPIFGTESISCNDQYIKYFISEIEILRDDNFSFISDELSSEVSLEFDNSKLIPNYMEMRLIDRIQDELCPKITDRYEQRNCYRNTKSYKTKLLQDYYYNY